MSLRAVLFAAPGRLATVDAVLRQFGWETTATTAENDLLERVGSRTADLVVIGATDGFNRSGLALTQAIRARDASSPVVLVTADSSEAFAI